MRIDKLIISYKFRKMFVRLDGTGWCTKNKIVSNRLAQAIMQAGAIVFNSWTPSQWKQKMVSGVWYLLHRSWVPCLFKTAVNTFMYIWESSRNFACNWYPINTSNMSHFMQITFLNSKRNELSGKICSHQDHQTYPLVFLPVGQSEGKSVCQ